MNTATENLPSFQHIAFLLSDGARALMIQALMSGRALTARELAESARITPQTASHHLGLLTHGGLIAERKQGRHKYFQIHDDQIAHMIEVLSAASARLVPKEIFTGPRSTKLRTARVCYDHLAGEVGVKLFDKLKVENAISGMGENMQLGENLGIYTQMGLQMDKGDTGLSGRCCLDWSERRDHLGGKLGRMIFTRMLEAHLITRTQTSREIQLTPKGALKLNGLLDL